MHEWRRQDDSEGQRPQQILLDQLHLYSPQTLRGNFEPGLHPPRRGSRGGG